MTTDQSKIFSADGYEILFRRKWPATCKAGKKGLAENIASIVEDGLFGEYYKLHYWAPKRGKEEKRGKAGERHFIKDHEGFLTTDTDLKDRNRFEEHLCMALWNKNELTWPVRNTGDIQLLDYQFPLQARDEDEVGDVDLLGLTDPGQLVVIEAKVSNNFNPLDALVEGLCYTAIVQANLDTIIEDVKVKFNKKVLDKPPILQLIAPKAWWKHWRNPSHDTPKRGEWKQPFKDLLANIEDELGIVTECLALKDLTMKDITWTDPDEKRPEIQLNPFDCPVLIGEKEPYGNPIA